MRQEFKKHESDIKVSIGDDCAVFKDGTIVTKDIFSEGTHFILKKMKPYNIGWRCFAAALSDIAAMAGTPLHSLLAIGIPSELEVEKLKEIVEGIKSLSSLFKVDLIGGDTIGSKFLFISFTIIGKAKKPVLRSGAKIGDTIYITGSIGNARMGYMLLRSGESPTDKFLKPIPKIREAKELIKNYHINSMIDISDGVLMDADHISEESGVGIDISSKNLPISESVIEFCKNQGFDPVLFSLESGDEYELLFSSPDEVDLPYVKKIGKIISQKGIFIDGRRAKIEGFDHFRSEI